MFSLLCSTHRISSALLMVEAGSDQSCLAAAAAASRDDLDSVYTTRRGGSPPCDVTPCWTGHVTRGGGGNAEMYFVFQSKIATRANK